MNEPTEKQLNAIRKLARATKSSVDLNKITTKQEASRILDELIAKRNAKSNSNNGNELRDRKAAYGLATKLVFRKYIEFNNRDYREGSEFWKEVDELYQQYLQHLDRAVKLGSQK